ncbi:MAG: MBL fold metallo-hydrolase [Pseudonocardiaceae bacterium]
MPEAQTLELTFLGHQSWHIRAGDAVVLLDPILQLAFGASQLEFTIWPPRTVDTEAMPAPDAVILSHEHLDHFHVPSLNALDRSVPVYTGTTTPAAMVEVIAALGFTVHRLDYSQPIVVGEMEIHLYPAGGKTLFWEKRVTQPLVRLVGTTGRDVFIGVDADVSDPYVEQIEEGALSPPYLAVVSNNAQTVPFGALGADGNLLPGLDGPRHRTTGVEVLHSLLIDYLAPLAGVSEVALCGNGFIAPRSPHGPFLYADHAALARMANDLQHVFRVHGPSPGDQLRVPAVDGPVTRSRVPWVELDTDAEQAGLERLAAFLADPRPVEPTPISDPIPTERWEWADARIAEELLRLARDLIATRTGSLATSIHDYLHGPLDGRRLILRLLDPPGRSGHIDSYAWDVTGPDFHPVASTGREEAMARYPFGIEIYHQDFAALFAGEVQIWDIIGGSYQGWNIGESLDSPVYALFAVYGEHQRPDLAELCYARSLATVGVEGGRGVSTAPVGPLEGATRVRPDGWLPHPLTSDPRLAEAQARSLFTEYHGEQRSVPLVCLTARYRTATFALGHPPERLFKRHADEAAHLGEVLAYQLLADDGVLPTLLSARDTSHTLIVDYLARPADLRAPGVFDELIAAVATVHTASARWDIQTSEVMAGWRVRNALATPTPNWITQPEVWRRLLRLTAAAHGPGHVPLGQLDLKADHARRQPDGRLAIIDAETLRPDLTGMPDLITLAWLAREINLPMTSREVRHAYRNQVNELGAYWSDTALVTALRAFADATGLHRLHDVAS